LTEALSRPAITRRLYTILARTPILGQPLRGLVRHVFPPETRIWFRISTGLGKGLWVKLDPRLEMDYATGNYESQVQQALSQYLHPGTVFYDVGAHIGVLTLVAARLVSNQGAVFAFEAEPANAARIKEHVRRNGLEQIQVLPYAVWSPGGCFRFDRALAQSSLNQGAVATGQVETTSNMIDVEAITLDDFGQKNAPPDLIKVDVEGGEAAVLRGSERVFSTKRPVLICEVHHEDALREVSRWLLERNYSFEWLMDSPGFPRHLLARWHE
jgi:FkbM family methyltransferase